MCFRIAVGVWESFYYRNMFSSTQNITQWRKTAHSEWVNRIYQYTMQIPTSHNTWFWFNCSRCLNTLPIFLFVSLVVLSSNITVPPPQLQKSCFRSSDSAPINNQSSSRYLRTLLLPTKHSQDWGRMAQCYSPCWHLLLVCCEWFAKMQLEYLVFQDFVQHNNASKHLAQPHWPKTARNSK